MRTGLKWAAGLAALAAVAVGAGAALAQGSDYEVELVMPDAANLLESSRVEIAGNPVGSVTGLTTRDGQAMVTVSLDGEQAPLHAGTTAQVQWRGVFGERVIELRPGPRANPEIPSGGMLTAGTEQVELDQVLAAMDPPTRAHLSSTVRQLDASLRGRPDRLRETLEAAGPAVQQLGAVLRAVGQDGPAIQSLITSLRGVMAPLSDRRAELQRLVGDLSHAMDSMSSEQGGLQQALGQLPSTLDTARQTMDRVPGAVDSAAPLLRDARPATRQLTSVSRSLGPVLADARPVVAQLRPTLGSATELLRQTPPLLDNAHAVLPGVGKAAAELSPAARFLRPYTPDAMGWISNWGGAFANYDAQGHYWHGLMQLGPSALDDNPGVSIGMKGGPNSRPAPGIATGQGWVDANGSGQR
jgi:phospholipid/cholesterol/gamma-HCH transport system substrate-binding protein